MRRIMLLAFLLASPAIAGGPKWSYKDPKLNDEMMNIYHDIRSANKDTTQKIADNTIAFAWGIKVSYLNTHTNHLIWDKCVLGDGNGNFVKDDTHTLVTMDLDTSGVNGLDQGTKAAATRYYLYIISDGTNFNGIYSTMTVSPSMPSGYSYYLMVGVVQTIGTAAILNSLQIGNYVQLRDPQNILDDTTTAGSEQTLNIPYGGCVPPVISWKVRFISILYATYSSAGNKSSSLFLGYNGAGMTQFIAQNSQYANTYTYFTWNGDINIINELPQGPQVNWKANYDSTGRTSFETFLWVQGYYLTELYIQ